MFPLSFLTICADLPANQVRVIEQFGGEFDAIGGVGEEELDPCGERKCGAEGGGDLVGGGELPEDGDSGAAIFAQRVAGDGRSEGE